MRVRHFTLAFLFVFLFAAAILPAAAQTLLATVPVGQDAYYLAANAVTNKIYVVNTCGSDPNCGSGPGTVTVINGLTNTVDATITVGMFPEFLVVNPVTNKIYVTNRHSNTVSVINGATNTVTTTIPVGSHPTVEDVDLVTNKIYVVNNGNGSGRTMSVIDGNTDTVTATVTVGNYPQAVAVNPVTNTIYVVNYCGNQGGCNVNPVPGTVSVIDGATNTVTHTVTVGYGSVLLFVDSATSKIWVGNSCGNVPSCDLGTGNDSNTIGTVTQIDGVTFATATANTGLGLAAMTFNSVANKAYVTNNTDNTATFIDGVTLATATVNVGLSPADVEVQTTNVILDINGYFAPVSGSTYAFYPLAPCRVADTRKSNFPPGLGPPFLTGGQQRDFPILAATSCHIPPSAAAYSLNFSVVPHGALYYMTVWPTGETRPLVSTLNDIPGQIIANAAIVPAGTGGDIAVYPTNDTDLVIDINGYFAPAGPGGLSLYPMAPCRVIDTRHVGNGQPFTGTLTPPVDVVDSPCGPPAAAQAYVFNATVVPTGALGYLTLWPDGQTKPLVSTLNALDGSITNNMAIVPSTNGKVDAYASGITQLILDISSYFAP